MTLGIIIGIIVCIAFIIITVDWSWIDAEEIFVFSILGIVIGLLTWGLVSMLGGAIVHAITKDDPYTLKEQYKCNVVAAKIETTGKYGTPAIVYTDPDMETHSIKIENLEFVDEDIEQPYIIVKKLEAKCHFVSHFYDNTKYEYHGSVKDLYNGSAGNNTDNSTSINN